MKPKMLLPNRWALQRHGFSGLVSVIVNRPELFAHIPQDFKGGRSLEENVAIAESLAKKNKGVLQNSWWLRKNGHSGLDLSIRKNREAFKHIPQERKHKTLEEYVALAESLAKKNKGVLQNIRWLIKNGHSGLDHSIRKNREAFKHIPQLRLSSAGQPI